LASAETPVTAPVETGSLVLPGRDLLSAREARVATRATRARSRKLLDIEETILSEDGDELRLVGWADRDNVLEDRRRREDRKRRRRKRSEVLFCCRQAGFIYPPGPAF
jgi:hypothetical protein